VVRKRRKRLCRGRVWYTSNEAMVRGSSATEEGDIRL